MTASDSGRRPIQPFPIRAQVLVGTLTIGLLVVGGGGWAATASLSGAIIAPGTVIVERNVKKVQHLDGGIVSEIAVKDGDRVIAGQIVMRLDATLTSSELGVIDSQLVELAARRIRLLGERDGRDVLSFPASFDAMSPGAADVRNGEQRLFAENRKARLTQKEQLDARIGQLREEIAGLEVQVASKSKELEIIQRELEQVRFLHKGKLTSVTRVYGIEREETKLSGERGSLLAQIARAKGQMSEIRLQITGVDQNARTEAQRDLRGIEARTAELSERQAAARDRLARMDIRAPQSGIVHELAMHTVGGVVLPAAPVMMIVPDNEKLGIEIRIAPADIDQLTIGQVVRLRFTAFNQRTTPEIDSSLVQIAASSSQDPKTGASYYHGRVEVDAAAAAKLGGLKLVPGMPVEAFVSTGTRTALSYMLKPLTDQFARAFREE